MMGPGGIVEAQGAIAAAPFTEEEKTELCRRKNRCFGPGTICKQHHEALADTRIDKLVAREVTRDSGQVTGKT